jgi:hypothetical protein
MPNTLYAVVVAAVLASTGAAAGDCGAAAATPASVDAATGAAVGAGASAAVEAGATLAVELEPPPPPPQATSVVPNTAIAAIRIAKCWNGSVMAGLQELLWGINYCPMEFLKVTPKQNRTTGKSKPLFRIFSKYNTTLSILLRILFVYKAKIGVFIQWSHRVTA